MGVKVKKDAVWINCQQFHLQWKFVKLFPFLSIPLSQTVEKNNAYRHSEHEYELS